MKKQNEGKKRISIEGNLESLSTTQVLDYYGGLLIVIAEQTADNKIQAAKTNREEVEIIKNYLKTKRLPNAQVKELKELFEERKPGEESEQILLELFAKKAVKGDDLIWAYNTNLWDHIEVCLEKKMKKVFTSFECWEEILEDASAGSKICKLAVEKLIPKANTLGKLLAVLRLNRQNILDVEVKKTNKAELLEKAQTIKITKEEAKIYKDEFEVKGGKVNLKNWK